MKLIKLIWDFKGPVSKKTVHRFECILFYKVTVDICMDGWKTSIYLM